jgi:hypothetical protein
MTALARRLGPIIAVALAAVLVSACIVDTTGPSASPSPSPSAGDTGAPSATASETASASLEASPSASSGPSSSAVPSPSTPGVACIVKPQTALLFSDRVVSVKVSTSATVDFVTFVFDVGSLTPAGPPRGNLTTARPPFTDAASGLPIDLAGAHAVQVRFTGMSLSNDAGEPTFTGEPDIKTVLPALKQVTLYDASEEIAGWYIGYDGTGCVGLVRDGNDITVTIAHS